MKIRVWKPLNSWKTPNLQHRTPNAEVSKDSRGHSMFGVGCSMLEVLPGSWACKSLTRTGIVRIAGVRSTRVWRGRLRRFGAVQVRLLAAVFLPDFAHRPDGHRQQRHHPDQHDPE